MAKKKDMTMTVDEARELVSNPVLWPRIRDFLWDFAAQTHESWLATEDRSAFDCRSLAKTSFRAKCFLLEKLGVEPCFYAFPKAGWSRLALLDGKTLESIAKWLGALACANALRHAGNVRLADI